MIGWFARRAAALVLVATVIAVGLVFLAPRSDAAVAPAVQSVAPMRAADCGKIDFITGKCAVDALTGGGCQAPTPDAPGYLWATSPQDPPTGDPFAPGANVGISEVYGLGGFGFVVCDLSIYEQTPRINNTVANWTLSIPKAGLATLDAVSVPAYEPDTWVHYLDPMVNNLVETTKRLFWTPSNPGGATFLTLMAFVAAFMLMGSARRGAISAVVMTLGVLVLTATLMAAIFAGPAKIASIADPVVPAIVGGFGEQLNGVTGGTGDGRTAAISAAVDSTLWEQWLRGQFGDATGTTATTYGPCIFKAKTFSWSEWAVYREDPTGAGKRIVDRKAAEWDRCAGEIKKDAVAYAAFAGSEAPQRPQAAVAALAIGVASQPMFVVSLVMLMVSMIIFRLLVISAPLAALWWITPKGHGVIQAYARIAAAVLVNSIVFGFGTIMSIVAYAAILSPANGMNSFLRLLLMAIFSLLLWLALWPFMRLTSWAKPANPIQTGWNITKGVGKAAIGVAGTALGVGAGIKATGIDHDWHNAREPQNIYRGGPQGAERTNEPQDTAWLRPEPAAPMDTDEWGLPRGPSPTVTATASDLPRAEATGIPARPIPALAAATPAAEAPARVDEAPGRDVAPYDEEMAMFQRTSQVGWNMNPAGGDDAPDYLRGYEDSGVVVENGGVAYVIYTPDGGFQSSDDIQDDDPAADLGARA